MAYNLPPAWDPGYALPDNVVDEGLQRRAFVTKQMPRGSYDNPSVGTAGYAVPKYVQDEGYGQGTYVTKWQPSGTYTGPRIPSWLNQRPQVVRAQRLPGGGEAVTVQPLGDDAMPEPYESYGQQAAQVLLSRVATLPANRRGAALKAIADKVDPSLWTRTQTIWQRYRQQGMDPAQALPLALARAMSAGIMAEIITTGVRRTAPQAQSLLGLGCYGCAAALGAVDMSSLTAGPIFTGGGAGAAPATAIATQSTPATDANGCQTMSGFTWVYGATVNGQYVPGHWARLAAGQTAVPFCPGGPPAGATTVASGTPIVRDQRDVYDWFVGPFGFNTQSFVPRMWALGTPSSTTANRAAEPDIMYLSPDTNFVPPQPNAKFVRALSPQVLAWLRARLTEEKDANGNTDTPTTYADPSGNRHPSSFLFDADGNLRDDIAADAQRWFDAMGIQPGTPVRLHPLWSIKTGGQPFVRTKHIKTGANMVLNVHLAPVVFTKPWDAKTNPLVLKVWLSTVPDPSIFGALWNPMILINPLTALEASMSVFDGVTNELGNLACDVLSHPAAGTVAGAAAAAYGIPPQAGTAGVAIAANQCGQAPPPPIPVIHRSIWPMAALTGGAVLAVALLTRRRKKAPAP